MKQPKHELPALGRAKGAPSMPGPSVDSLSEAILRAVLASVLDPTVTIDEHGKILLASDSVEGVFGWKPAELVGQNVRLLMPEPHSSAHDDYLANYRRTGITHILNQTREFVVRKKNGEPFEIELSVARADLPGENSPVFVGSFRDISKRKQAERALLESEKRFHAIFDQSFRYVGLLKPDGRLIEVNRAFLDAGGLCKQDVLERPFWEAHWWSHDREEAQRCRQAVARAAAGEFVRYEAAIRGKDEQLLSIDFSLTPISDESGAVVMLIPEGHDTTEFKRIQRSETQMLRALATVGESAAVLAHEIKNPITAINFALRAVADQLGQDHRVILEDLSSRMMRLERMLRRTLSFVKPIDLRFAQLDIAEVVSASVRLLRPMIVKAGVDIRTTRTEADVHLQGDRALLEEVIVNLLANAVEALEGRPSPGIVDIRIDASPDGPLRVKIADNGPGVPQSVCHTLFQPYVTTKSRGTGLGLAFCKKVIDEHHGSIVVGVSETGGACFEITLPRTQPKC